MVNNGIIVYDGQLVGQRATSCLKTQFCSVVAWSLNECAKPQHAFYCHAMRGTTLPQQVPHVHLLY